MYESLKPPAGITLPFPPMCPCRPGQPPCQMHSKLLERQQDAAVERARSLRALIGGAGPGPLS